MTLSDRDPPPTKPSASKSTNLKKFPSNRISQLVSRFEPPAPSPTSETPLPSGSASRTEPSSVASLRLPAKPASLARSWSKLGGGRVEQNVRRFSTDKSPVTTDEHPKPEMGRSRRRESVKSLDYVQGSVEGMDWTPRTKPPVSTPPSAPTAPPPGARFLNPPKAKQSVAADAMDKREPGLLSASNSKSSTAQTVTVPALVTASSSIGETKMKIPAVRCTSEEVEPPSQKPDSEGGKDSTEPAAVRQGSTLPAAPLPPFHSYSYETVSSASPSSATSEATVVEKKVRSRPALDQRKTSLTFVDSEKDHDNASTTSLPRGDSKLRQFNSSSTLFPSSLDLPPSLPPPFIRPSLPRGATSFRTTSTAATHSYPAHQVFARDAGPLHLPDLDKLLESLGGLPEFSKVPVNVDEPSGEDIKLHRRGEKTKGENVLGSEEERKSWNEWVRGKPPSLWDRLMSRSTSYPSSEDDKERLIDKEAGSAGLTKEQYERSLIFPPFHQLPPNATLSDLKSNVRKPPGLLSRNGLLQMAADGALNLFGSAAGIKLTTVEGLRDLMQMFTLLVTSASPKLAVLTVSNPISPPTVVESSTFRTLFITIPSAVSLDFASAFGHAFLFLFVFTFLAFLALYEFYRFTGGWKGPTASNGGGGAVDLGEGYDQEDLHVRKQKFRDRKGWKIFITFFLTTIYLPLSKLSLSALFWERGYWPSEMMGTERENDRCFTTIPRGENGFNSAIVIFPVALLVLAILACWFPIRMYRVVKGAKPHVDKWTELGELRRDKKGEYERLLDKDPSPFSFLYREYRREWAGFRSIYMAVKLLNVFIVVLISTDNCVFLKFSETKLDIIRQGTLFAFMTAFFLLDVYSRPQLDAISNRSDRISRFGYVGISLCGLLVALDVPGKSFWDGSAIVILNSFAYSFNFYFAIISTQLLRRVVKRVQHRLDFSIDVFSPQLDLSKHVSRRIWQETLSTLFLTAPEFAMDPTTTLKYSGSPPYLLHFHGTVAERHAENLKILRDVGLDGYYDGLTISGKSGKGERSDELRRILQHRIAGPHAYYRPSSSPSSSVTTFFGRLDLIPFPFVAIFRYDQDPSSPLRLSSLEELETLVHQYDLPAVRSARKVRLVLRSLEGQVIVAPRIETKVLEEKKGFKYAQQVSYESATLKIGRNSSFVWQGYNCSSGFEVSLEWRNGVGIGSNGKLRSDFGLVLPGNQCGVGSDFAITRYLATLFRDNRRIIEHRLPLIEDALERHRRFFAQEADSKRRTLSYEFLFSVFAEDRLSSQELDLELRRIETNEKVRNLVTNHPATFRSLEERMKAVAGSRIRAWWFIVFDDLFRRNGVFKSKASDFSPHYSSSICYRPMPRAQLEAFLEERGFPSKPRAFFSPGFLNQIYFVLDEIAFSATDHAVPIHLASDPLNPVHHSSLPRKFTPPRGSESTNVSKVTAGTGDGTNEDDRDIRARRGFLFEEAFERPRPPFASGQRWEATKFFLTVRLKRGTKRWLGWTLNETDHRNRGEDEILLDLRPGQGGWEAPRFTH